MRAIWKGAVTFGLVNVPVKVFSATEDHDVSLHQVHAADHGRIRYQRVCEACGEVVAFADIDKAYVDAERMVVLTGDDLAALPQRSYHQEPEDQARRHTGAGHHQSQRHRGVLPRQPDQRGDQSAGENPALAFHGIAETAAFANAGPAGIFFECGHDQAPFCCALRVARKSASETPMTEAI